jgi:hypothetical protein
MSLARVCSGRTGRLTVHSADEHAADRHRDQRDRAGSDAAKRHRRVRNDEGMPGCRREALDRGKAPPEPVTTESTSQRGPTTGRARVFAEGLRPAGRPVSITNVDCDEKPPALGRYASDLAAGFLSEAVLLPAAAEPRRECRMFVQAESGNTLVGRHQPPSRPRLASCLCRVKPPLGGCDLAPLANAGWTGTR